MKLIDIQINKARIKSFSVEFAEDGLPVVAATISLLGPAGKEITCYSISTQSWRSDKFELPAGMINPICAIGEMLEGVVVQECNKALNMLAAPVPPAPQEVENA